MDKSELQNYRALACEVRQLRVRISELETTLYSPKGQRLSKTPRAAGNAGRTMDDVVVRHIELEELLHVKLADLAEQQLTIEKSIQALELPAHRLVLRHRYLDGLGWRRIVDKLQPLGYSERQVYRLHGEALLLLKEV